jgi:hypothetical protein
VGRVTCAREDFLELRALECAAPNSLELSRRAWKRDRERSPGLEDDARRRPRQAERASSLRERRLLADAGLELLIRAPEALGEPSHHRLDLPLELRVDGEVTAGSASKQLDRAVVVRRSEPAGGDDQVEGESVAKRCLKLLRPVADDADPLRLDAARRELAREEGAVLVDPSAPDELAARDEDGRSKCLPLQA